MQWVPWPEDHFTLQHDDDNTRDWTVFPLVHTFPAFDVSKKSWVASTCNACPKTTGLLKQLPRIRTALFSKLGPGTQVFVFFNFYIQILFMTQLLVSQLSSHTGWADLANHVLRCHLCLDIPSDGNCGLLVDGEVSCYRWTLFRGGN